MLRVDCRVIYDFLVIHEPVKPKQGNTYWQLSKLQSLHQKPAWQFKVITNADSPQAKTDPDCFCSTPASAWNPRDHTFPFSRLRLLGFLGQSPLGSPHLLMFSSSVSRLVSPPAPML